MGHSPTHVTSDLRRLAERGDLCRWPVGECRGSAPPPTRRPTCADLQAITMHGSQVASPAGRPRPSHCDGLAVRNQPSTTPRRRSQPHHPPLDPAQHHPPLDPAQHHPPLDPAQHHPPLDPGPRHQPHDRVRLVHRSRPTRDGSWSWADHRRAVPTVRGRQPRPMHEGPVPQPRPVALVRCVNPGRSCPSGASPRPFAVVLCLSLGRW
jgi:hypothetical protein